MSQDNYIYIEQLKTKYNVWDCVASCVAGKLKGNELIVTTKDLQKQKACFIGSAKTLEGAIKIARKESSEYGINFDLWCK